MNFELRFLLIASLMMLSFSLPKAIQKKVDAEIKDIFQIENFEFNAVYIPSEEAKALPSKFGNDNFFEIKSKDSLLGYAYVSKAPSKTDNFDYLVLLDPELIILKTKVLVYREDYGGEIGSKRWLKQFIGKTEDDNLRYGDNIVAISGATISVKSFTDAINKLLQSLKILHLKHIL
ncbi:FMN-binding protein [Yeosuana marina]|uniref:FMN-binding protein n=1 Tax=Yeosuana marina TaxID=1565536 RepID=UPI0030C83C84